jgi:predicted dehydrogenase
MPLGASGPMKVAVVGLGYWGSNLVRNLYALDACSQLVVCDTDEARVKEISKSYPTAVGCSDY